MKEAPSVLAPFEPLLRIACCPHTRAPLTLMTVAELETSLVGLPGQSIPIGTVGALLSREAARAYPIIGQVISFLEQDTLRLSRSDDPGLTTDPPAVTATKQEVKRWYDEFGWKRTDSGGYGDTALFSQVGNSAHGFYETDSHLSILDRFPGGEFLLDAASGAIPHPEYLAYSRFYRYRVCVDMSLTALREAATKLGSRGFYCMADICRLPFRNDAFDGVVSAYTIQHVPAVSQTQALVELHRVLAPGCHCCILTDVGPSLARSVLRRAMRLLARIRPVSRQKHPTTHTGVSAAPPGRLYGHAPSLAWWRHHASALGCEFSLKALRLLSKPDFDGYFADSLRAAKTLRKLEITMPKALARYSQYALIEISKTRRGER